MKWLLALLAVVLIGMVYWYNQHNPLSCQRGVTSLPNGTTLTFEVARTVQEQEWGLSHRTSLPLNQGMLFVFPTPSIYTFWMKDTLIPLDIVWINHDQIVDSVTLQPQQGNDIPQYTPHVQADRVLEVNAGQAEANGLTLGAPFRWTDPCVSPSK